MKKILSHKFEDIISLDNLLLAWQEFIIGKKNKKDVQDFSYNLFNNILSLHEDLASGSYRHGGYKSFYVNDPKRRHIHKASVRDRLLHHAVCRILYPFFDRKFIADSFSCRLGKGTHKAINRFRQMAYTVSKNNTRTCWILKCDIRKFFASVDHKILIGILKQHILDEKVIGLLENIVGSFEADKQNSVSFPRPAPRSFSEVGRRESSYISGSPNIASAIATASGMTENRIGLPLGNLTSQLFANIYMDEFDQWVKHKLKVKYYIRYADDFVFLSEERSYLELLTPVIGDFLKNRLKLSLHPDKVFIKTIASGVDFLGWVNFGDHRILRGTTKRRLLKRVKLNPQKETIQSYLGLLGHGNTYDIQDELKDTIWLFVQCRA